ncbi:MAG: hypothetical protein J7L10_02480, partial [Methanomicrobia archaeon]|nr:hypothetical protein [Methanomicrobia archaeon]
MKSKIISIMFSLLIVTSIYINLTLAKEKADKPPIVKVLPQRGSTTLGENYIIEVILTNPNEEDKADIYKCYVEIDTDKISEEYIEIIKGKAEITKFGSEEEVTVELIIKFKDNAPEGEYTIPIKVTGRWIACSSGCTPFQPQYEETKVSLTILKPMVMVYYLKNDFSIEENDYSIRGGGELEIPFSIKNVATGKAFNISIKYDVDDELLENLKCPEIPKELDAGEIINEKLYLNTEGIDYGDYSLKITVEYFDSRNKRYKPFEKECSIHVLGPSEEEINQEKLNKAAAAEREAATLLSKDEFDSALEKYKEAKTLYEEVGITTKVNDMNSKINLVEETIQKIEENTKKADQNFQNGVQYMN